MTSENPFEESENSKATINPFEDQTPTSDAPSLPPKKRNPFSKPSNQEFEYETTKYTQGLSPIINQFSTEIELTPEGIERKKLELKRKEEDITRREQSLKNKEGAIAKAQRKKNWPPCKPVVYQNIAEDIPEDNQPMVKRAYIAWFAVGIAYIWNFIVLISAGEVVGSILGIIYFFVNVPLAFLIYRALYHAARKNRPSLYMIYFISVWLLIIAYGFLCVGFSSFGAAGIILAITEFSNKSSVLGIMAVVAAIVWGILTFVYFGLFIDARVRYKKAGGLLKAKGEIADETVKQMAEHPELVEEGIKATQKSKKEKKSKKRKKITTNLYV